MSIRVEIIAVNGTVFKSFNITDETKDDFEQIKKTFLQIMEEDDKKYITDRAYNYIRITSDSGWSELQGELQEFFEDYM